MPHSGHYEEPVEILGLLERRGIVFSHPCDHPLVVLNVELWGEARIDPSVILDELSVALLKSTEIRIDRVNLRAFGVTGVRQYHVAVEVQIAVFPIRLVEHDPLQIFRRWSGGEA